MNDRPQVNVRYLFDGDHKTRRHLYLKLYLLGSLMVAAGLVSGLIRAPGTVSCFYVLVPFTISFGTTLALVWGLIRIQRSGEVLSKEEYEATLDQFPPRGTCTAVCAGCAVVGELFYVWRHGAEGLLSGMIVFLICQAVVLAGGILWVRITDDSPWRKEEI